jgi:hypothetical protein
MFGCAGRAFKDVQASDAGQRLGFLALCGVLTACAVSFSVLAAAEESLAAPTEHGTRPRQASHAAIGGTLEHRVAVLSKALDLDAGQQAKLRGILERQREAVHKVWSDSTLLPSERAPATHAVGDRTADSIRTILTEEQNKKYNPPKAPLPASAGSDVESWMTAQRVK